MNKEPEHIDFLNLIVRELSGELGPEDQLRLEQWLESDQGNRKTYEEYRKLWQQMDMVEGRTSEDVDREWRRLENAIDRGTSMPAKKTGMLWKLAASLILFLSLGAIIWYFLNTSQMEQVVAVNRVETLVLPEGSSVALNVGSELKYKGEFGAKSREVELSGEAFFEVEADVQRPFIIRVGRVRVQVLGTSFNVKAYEESKEIEVTVEAGKVKVYWVDDPANQLVLVRGEKAILNKAQKELKALENNDINFKAWVNRRIFFEDTPMSEVVKIINEVYQANILLEGTELKNCPITTEFDNQSLETILSVLSSTLDLKIERRGEQIIISGEGC
jgi:ferric-dicitrate binding protein FerR (iron transport regulator)